MRNLALSISILILACCSRTGGAAWKGGKITEPGTYELEDESLKIEVYLERNFVRYKAYDNEGRTVISYGYNMSTVQRWAFYLDEQRNFWVFSSDIGHSVWKKGTASSYFHDDIDHVLTRREVPKSVYDNCKEFFRD
ncbi:hypothetical protein [Chryseolinea serpens]|uniref:hypothetical protein n=1 Tax=Chryseolinea serpens TaxID=947013 RepID=UPI0009333E5A|nr:hypothetical protein [Chryseolinea serpens]